MAAIASPSRTRTPPPSYLLKRRALRNAQAKSRKHTDISNGNLEQENGSFEETDYDDLVEATPQNELELLAVLYHFSMTVFYALLLYYGTKLVDDNRSKLDPTGIIPSYGGHFKFLTHFNLWFQLIFFGVQFFTDLLHVDSTLRRNLQNICDVLFTTIAAPTSLFVASTFWAVYAYDRSLVYPDRFDLFVPQYMNHFWHTTIVVWVAFENILCFHRYPSVGVAACVNFVVNAAYLSWIVWIFVQTNFWVYPILKVLPLHYLTVFCAGCMFLSLFLYFVGQAFAQLRWGKTLYIQ